MNFDQLDALHDDILEQARITPAFVDKDIYRLSIATLWANTALDPLIQDLEPLHEHLNSKISAILGDDFNLVEIFRFIKSKNGDEAMQQARLSTNHQDLLTYFSSLILDPARHKQWLEQTLAGMEGS